MLSAVADVPEDYQQYSVYNWEERWRPYVKDVEISLTQMQNLAAHIAGEFLIPVPAIYTIPGSLNSFAQGSSVHMATRSKRIFIHEMAHVVTFEIMERQWNRWVEGHGPEFISYYVRMIKEYLGISADYLLGLAHDFRVCWDRHLLYSIRKNNAHFSVV